MAKLTRKLQKIFSLTSSENGQFGSAADGSANLSDDIDTLQNLSAWVGGWSEAVVGGQNLPPLEEMNAIQYTITRQLQYLFEQGIPEYLSSDTYYTDSIAREAGTQKLYVSLTDNNTGNALTDTTNWRLLINLNPVDSIAEKNADYEITNTDGLDTILVSGETTITLPEPASNVGRKITIKRVGNSQVIIARNSNSDEIDGNAQDFILWNDYQSVTVIASAANTWYIV